MIKTTAIESSTSADIGTPNPSNQSTITPEKFSAANALPKKPDNVIFLHAPFDLVTEIRNARKVNDGVMNDIHERDLEFMKRVYESAMFVADYLSWDQINCVKGNGLKSIEEIHEDVYSFVKKKK